MIRKAMDQISQHILELVKNHPNLSSSEIHDALQSGAELITTKRKLKKLLDSGLLFTSGNGRSTRYFLSPSSQLLEPIDLSLYFTKEVDERVIQERFNVDLIKKILPSARLFSNEELAKLNALQEVFQRNIAQLPTSLYQKEMERLAIDLSWKSSQIEGNTYSLLETEQLIKEQKEAAGKKREEAIMLLNHKKALDFIVEDASFIAPLTIAKIESIHSLLIQDLGIDRNIRTRLVGITGTNYRPLDNEFLIREALADMCTLVNAKENVFEKALLLLVLISYIQPFADGNKRTARITSNALLMNQDHCPFSFRTVDSMEYKKAMLVFYEQNNISPFKQIFIDQFAFAVGAYFG